MNKSIAKQHIKETCGDGWLNLVDIIYDNKPEEVAITEVFQKWGGLKVTYTGEDKIFDELVASMYLISQKICEICGTSAGYAIIDGWETTLCNTHYNASNAKEKYKPASGS